MSGPAAPQDTTLTTALTATTADIAVIQVAPAGHAATIRGELTHHPAWAPRCDASSATPSAASPVTWTTW